MLNPNEQCLGILAHERARITQSFMTVTSNAVIYRVEIDQQRLGVSDATLIQKINELVEDDEILHIMVEFIDVIAEKGEEELTELFYQYIDVAAAYNRLATRPSLIHRIIDAIIEKRWRDYPEKSWAADGPSIKEQLEVLELWDYQYNCPVEMGRLFMK